MEIAIKYNDHGNVANIYQEAFEDADKQYLEIRAAREHLLDFDFSGKTECGILPEQYSDEKVNWEFNEPQLGPLTADEMNCEILHQEGSEAW